MRLKPLFVLASLLFLLLPSVEMKRAGKGRGLKRARHKITQDRVRVRGVRRHSRSGPSGLVSPSCSELKESGKIFMDCQDRQLTFIPPANSWSRKPRHLLLARNRIKILHDGAFLGYDSLTSLDLQQNQILQVEEGAFQGLTRLKTLLLQHNRLTTLSDEALIPMPNLRDLRLYDNPWKCLCQLESLIRTLQVPSNRNLGGNARCAEPLWLKKRKLKTIDPELLCAEGIILQTGNNTNALEPIPLRGKADSASLCHTYLFPHMRMDCSKRGLTEVPSGIPDDVVEVDLSHNLIRRLRLKDFLGASGLRILNLSSNSMEHIDHGSLFGLLHLQELDLSDNDLHFVQYGVLEDLYFLSRLKLGGNPWVCNYSIHYMVYWLRLHPAVKHSGLWCHSPSEFARERVEDYVQSYNRECPKDKQSSRTEPDTLDPVNWGTAMELQGEVEEDLEPSHLRAPKKYEVYRLS
ncbi:Leucine-rich repeat-containing protein 17 [Oryzias melastigma]|uniref:Leucine-rich repeat-containing protein 17 n=1 Tax=Oryzias melastigma TaxID=30732 RepID=A0A3B3BU79_ORYME|nr:leucine-rich repeat-containing protein 17 [Oryzias melastigma]KAF6735622.1 Leucine-rich repeat-containing protein 17 [Oryzias melastigma]